MFVQYLDQYLDQCLWYGCSTINKARSAGQRTRRSERMRDVHMLCANKLCSMKRGIAVARAAAECGPRRGTARAAECGPPGCVRAAAVADARWRRRRGRVGPVFPSRFACSRGRASCSASTLCTAAAPGYIRVQCWGAATGQFIHFSQGQYVERESAGERRIGRRQKEVTDPAKPLCEAGGRGGRGVFLALRRRLRDGGR